MSGGASGKSPREGTTRRQVLTMASGAAAISLLGSDAKADLDLFHLRSHWKRRESRLTSLKTQAIQDYRLSVLPYGGRLSNPPEQLQQHAADGTILDVLVVGSGYGGAVNAARLAERLRPGGQLAVLERGREWVPGTFPDTLDGLMNESRRGVLGPGRKRFKNPLGLLDLSFHDEFYVLSGSGLGGGSLINAGVAVAPDPDVFRQSCWPAALRDIRTLTPYFDLVAHELNLQVIDCDTDKVRALQYVAHRQPGGRATTKRASVTAAFRGRGLVQGRNRQGMIQRPCTLCGDCSTGCNVGAKSTLPMTYLPWAKRFGAQLYTQTEVDFLQHDGQAYCVHFTQHQDTATGVRSCRGRVRARIVILSAGSLGSTGILLRSQSSQLPFSPCLGTRWSGNGDTYGFLVRSHTPTNAGGVGAYATDQPPVGVTQQMHLFLHHEQLRARMLLQEGAVPRAFANALGGLVGDLDLDRSMAFFGLGHDGAKGTRRLA